MPLHLLGKKSWNPYAPRAVERVRADEAAAAAEEEALDEKRDEYDAKTRLARLRGDSPPPLPLELSQREGANVQYKGRKRERGDNAADDRHKRRRINGEDDTERDIRLAREGEDSNADQQLAKVVQDRKKDASKAAPITDRNGHIQLFAPIGDDRARKVEKNAEAEKERKEHERQFEDQYTMRFSNAAGFRQNPKEGPWYDRNTLASRSEGQAPSQPVARNAFGREDPRRPQRDVARMTSADPMAAMKMAQSKLKEGEKQRRIAQKEREEELRDLRAHQERRERRHRRKHRDKEHRRRDHGDVGALEGFRLNDDGLADGKQGDPSRGTADLRRSVDQAERYAKAAEPAPPDVAQPEWLGSARQRTAY